MNGDLTFVRPTFPGAKVERNVFATAEVSELIDGALLDHPDFSEVAAQARAKIDSFSMGRKVIFALNPHSKDDAALVARNGPVGKGVVDLRIRSPRPALRIFGCFAETDLLLLLTWAPREKLHFPTEVKRCRQVWDQLFPNHEPMIGQTHADYISSHALIG